MTQGLLTLQNHRCKIGNSILPDFVKLLIKFLSKVSADCCHIIIAAVPGPSRRFKPRNDMCRMFFSRGPEKTNKLAPFLDFFWQAIGPLVEKNQPWSFSANERGIRPWLKTKVVSDSSCNQSSQRTGGESWISWMSCWDNTP